MQSEKKLIVITGASSGIGLAATLLFAEKGYPLLLLARRLETMENLKLSNCLCLKCDVTDYAQVEAAIKQGEAKFGPVDCMINNAGVMLLGDCAKQSLEEWNQMIDVNCKGLLNGVKCVLPGMKERKTGTVINVSSIAGKKTFQSHAVYCGTKFFVHAVTENMREEMSQNNVRFTTIAPGVVETELITHVTDNAILDGYKEWKKTLGGKGLEAKTVADAIYFAYSQPQSCCIREIALAPTLQAQ